jgi:hypothetical protein
MRRIGILVAMGLLWLVTDSAHAQVREGDLRLFLDGSLFGWMKQVDKTEGGGLSVKDETTTKATSLLGGGGIGLGYAVSRYIVPELYASVQSAKIEDDSGTASARQWELRPCLEVPLLPSRRVVPYVMGGLTMGRLVTKDIGDDDISMFGLGPALGAGAHAFLTEHASLDVSLNFRGTFFVQNDLADALPAGVDLKTRQYALLLNVGASFWL